MATLDHALQTNIREATGRLQSQFRQLLQAAPRECVKDQVLEHLSLYLLGMLKSAAMRADGSVPVDTRCHLWNKLDTLPVFQLASFYYPRLFALHQLRPGDEIALSTPLS